jgi:hypothetical protein
MNTQPLARLYDALSAEERFRLILAAGFRGDEAEQRRLSNAGGRLTLSVQDHQPFAQAFDELALLTFLELLEAAADYLESFHHSSEVEDAGDAEDDALRVRYLDLSLGKGFLLRTKAAGWRLFCERLAVPPFALCEGLPGFDRLQRALKLTEVAAFAPEGMLAWLNRVRPEGEPEMTELKLTPEGCAAALDRFFRECVRWWGGEAS